MDEEDGEANGVYLSCLYLSLRVLRISVEHSKSKSMKILLFSNLFLSLVSAVAVPGATGKVNYDGYKVVRLQSSAQVKSMIQGLSLKTWNGAAKDDGEVDVVIPPGVKAFDGMDMQVMHEDLGASIAQEAKYDAYAGTL